MGHNRAMRNIDETSFSQPNYNKILSESTEENINIIIYYTLL